MALTEAVANRMDELDLAVDDVPLELFSKHPLQNSWSLWFYRNERSRSWEDNLMKISTFNAVEDFWALYNHLENVSKLPVGCDYAVFKDGVKPMWEDPKNVKGGRWLVTVPKHQHYNDLDRCWLEVLLCMIGETFDGSNDDICGAVVQVRNRADKLALWTANANNEDAVLRVGKIMKERLNLPQGVNLIYEPHEISQSKTGLKHKFCL